jgi:hypothetical protein
MGVDSTRHTSRRSQSDGVDALSSSNDERTPGTSATRRGAASASSEDGESRRRPRMPSIQSVPTTPRRSIGQVGPPRMRRSLDQAAPSQYAAQQRSDGVNALTNEVNAEINKKNQTINLMQADQNMRTLQTIAQAQHIDAINCRRQDAPGCCRCM